MVHGVGVLVTPCVVARTLTHVVACSTAVCSLLGGLHHQFYFSFHLADVVLRYNELRIVLSSVLKPIKSLFLTAVVSTLGLEQSASDSFTALMAPLSAVPHHGVLVRSLRVRLSSQRVLG